MSIPRQPSQAIILLEQAALAARRFDVDRWQFAVELEALTTVGVTVTELRLLVKTGVAAHAREISKNSSSSRRFAPLRSLYFPVGTCFAMPETQPSGQEQVSGDVQDLDPYETPRWDKKSRTLQVGSQIVKRFKVPAEAQEAVLTAFQEESWPQSIDDPLKLIGGQVQKQRLHNTINALNRGQLVKLIKFRGNGKGTAVTWEFYGGRSGERV